MLEGPLRCLPLFEWTSVLLVAPLKFEPWTFLHSAFFEGWLKNMVLSRGPKFRSNYPIICLIFVYISRQLSAYYACFLTRLMIVVCDKIPRSPSFRSLRFLITFYFFESRSNRSRLQFLLMVTHRHRVKTGPSLRNASSNSWSITSARRTCEKSPRWMEM